MSDSPILFPNQRAFVEWLAANHDSSAGLWLCIAKKNAAIGSVTYAEALDAALCYGWIDSQKKSWDESSFLQRFTPRGPKSIWSRINREKIAALARNRKAREFFATLTGANRYAVLFRIQTAKRPGTRARRIEKIVAMLARRETYH